jgi:TPR repeat protein
MSLGCPFKLLCASRRDKKTPIGVGRFTLMGGLLLIAALAHAADNGCKAAYDDGTRSGDVARCEAAARAGGPNAEFEYGLLLWSGHDGATDKKSALDWFRLSARQGHYLAQVMLGKMLSDTTVDANLRNPVEGYVLVYGCRRFEGSRKGDREVEHNRCSSGRSSWP